MESKVKYSAMMLRATSTAIYVAGALVLSYGSAAFAAPASETSLAETSGTAPAPTETSVDSGDVCMRNYKHRGLRTGVLSGIDHYTGPAINGNYVLKVFFTL